MWWTAALRAARKNVEGLRGDMRGAAEIAGCCWSGVCRGCRGGPWPARGPCGGAGSPGTMRASSPTEVCGIARFAFFRLAAGLATIRRGGFHIRPRGVRAAANRADMESAPTGVCSDAWPRPSRLAQSAKFIRRGGIYPARRRVSEANRRAAEALRPEIPPAGLAAAQGPPGRCEHRPLQGLRLRRAHGSPVGRRVSYAP